MARSLLLIALGVAACTDGVFSRGDDLGPFLRLSGSVDPDAPISGERTRGAVAWVWLREGELGSVVTEVPFEPLVYRYALTLSLPPDPGTGALLPEEELSLPGVTLLFGLPLLIEPAAGAFPDVALKPRALLDWVRGASPSLREALPDETVAAATAGHLLMLLHAEDGAERLTEADAWEQGHPLCQVDQAVEGLTLYRVSEGKCGGWEPLAEPGERTEFQGVPMRALP